MLVAVDGDLAPWVMRRVIGALRDAILRVGPAYPSSDVHTFEKCSLSRLGTLSCIRDHPISVCVALSCVHRRVCSNAYLEP